jgi:hypothetical protein
VSIISTGSAAVYLEADGSQDTIHVYNAGTGSAFYANAMGNHVINLYALNGTVGKHVINITGANGNTSDGIHITTAGTLSAAFRGNTLQADMGGRVLGNTATAFSGVGVESNALSLPSPAPAGYGGIISGSSAFTAANGTPIQVPVNYTFTQAFSFASLNDASWTQILFTIQTNQKVNLLQVQLSNPPQGDDGLSIRPTGASLGDGSITGVATSPFGFTVNIDPTGMNIPPGTYNWEATIFGPGKQRPAFGTFQAMSAVWTNPTQNA